VETRHKHDLCAWFGVGEFSGSSKSFAVLRGFEPHVNALLDLAEFDGRPIPSKLDQMTSIDSSSFVLINFFKLISP